FGVDADEVKSVSVMEGDSVILHHNFTHIQRPDEILWMFEPQGTDIAKIHKQSNSSYIYDDDERFKGKLQLDDQTGSLTITKISIKNSGLYKLNVRNNKQIIYTKFNVTVYAHLLVPVIIRNSQCSSEKCVLLCSVMNVTHVSLSWYKGNSLLSNISVSDLNIRLSLPLEVEYQDTNTYSCFISNPITNHTQHLDITEHCQLCLDLNLLISTAVIVVTVFLLWLVAFVIYRHKKASSNGSATIALEFDFQEYAGEMWKQTEQNY
ncbi:SLAM family member 9-like, partial [Triplophysa dalaica]|uniref:SLAM family member 9-like n=1 Tax=Triplophysa dalaica TaxID=1582913 RepID=UPI0024DF929D